MTRSRVCTINARGGSKGVPGKNLCLVNGLPLVQHSIEQAIESRLFDVIAVSSDSSEILDIAVKCGVVPIKRPADLATDTAPKLPAIQHSVLQVEAISGRKFDVVVDLDATSPLREVLDIQGAVQLLESENLESVFTATPSRRSPYFNQVSLDGRGVWGPVVRPEVPITRRQDAPKTYDMNASIYVWTRDALIEKGSVFLSATGMFLMPEARSWDVDSFTDLEFVSFLMEKRDVRKR